MKNANDIQEAVNTVKRLLPPSAGIFSDFVSSSCVNMSIFYKLKRLLSDCVNTHVDSSVITRHSLVRVKGEVFVLLYVFLFFVFLFVCLFVCSVNDFSTTRRPIHAKVRMRTYSGSGCVFSPFGGWRQPAGGKRGK